MQINIVALYNYRRKLRNVFVLEIEVTITALIVVSTEI
jgi:hypothetical protein